MTKIPTPLALAILLLCACGGGTGQANRPDTLTRRQRDSAIGASRLPGAQGVRGALQAQDSAAARNRRLDSIAREPQ
ncbi:MAG: hypothetical protein HYW06_11655 [Gemmatimonadetes bacterium]|nr:hypothetical protein [Gemmatimonadota bacterium]MBI2537590.1 hypothetical protein [Gemmatimonadota bacterium]MBI3082166.1 hypothetical protein [Gemmatimonadota bacterium]